MGMGDYSDTWGGAITVYGGRIGKIGKQRPFTAAVFYLALAQIPKFFFCASSPYDLR